MKILGNWNSLWRILETIWRRHFWGYVHPQEQREFMYWLFIVLTTEIFKSTIYTLVRCIWQRNVWSFKIQLLMANLSLCIVQSLCSLHTVDQLEDFSKNAFRKLFIISYAHHTNSQQRSLHFHILTLN